MPNEDPEPVHRGTPHFCALDRFNKTLEGGMRLQHLKILEWSRTRRNMRVKGYLIEANQRSPEQGSQPKNAGTRF
ncbi:hypothetical protein QJS10_CPA01g00654 [Acorus calamus]|uniref:Uncharacterized protein n=1 Tax=Acorus calamus TaxID=4465 RepID=A0AAV9FMI1_ACOCL|nr:hypothetical protein QJS10_CPA01g00654 [Acorus calamus]